ncbi:MAG TPA: hypothetical protein DCM05_04010 [Elusimicrobia bacterium]|nr:hypothetical protein [Elusimicrobiota bacterium]
MVPPQTLDERIRSLRMKQGLKQNELARRLRVCKTAVCQWEMGQTKPRPEHLERLAGILGVTRNRLVSGLARSPQRRYRR